MQNPNKQNITSDTDLRISNDSQPKSNAMNLVKILIGGKLATICTAEHDRPEEK